jgi:glycosyltransferase involved in cell wall biosynthesis
MHLNIALDATYSLDENLSGVGVYSRELLAGLAAAYPECKFRWCYRPHRFRKSWGATFPANVRRGLLQEPFVPRGADLFHGLNQRLPRARLRHAVATFHDLFVLTGEYSTPEFRHRFAEQARHAAAEAEAIITVSEFTARQVQELLGVEHARIHVVHHGITAKSVSTVAREKVILHVGAIQRRKNLARLVDAFERVDPAWRLVLAGSNGYGADEIMRRIESSPARNRIVLPGYVSRTELASWYVRATIFAFPSLDEGFGMPVLEAMAAGVPVLTSNRSALPEVAGDAAILVDPEDKDTLAHALRNLTESEELRADLALRGRARAQKFSWTAAVERTWEVYQSLLTGSRRPPRS